VAKPLQKRLKFCTGYYMSQPKFSTKIDL